MKKGWLIISVAMLAVLALAVLSASVSAQEAGAGCPSTTKFNGTIQGGIYFQQHGWMVGDSYGSHNVFNTTFQGMPSYDNITVVRVYTGVWGGSPGHQGGMFNITVNGNVSPDYYGCDPCPGEQNCEAHQSQRCNVVNTSECHDYITGCNVQFISYNATGRLATAP